MAGVTREIVKVESEEPGVFLDVWLYKPPGDGPFPVVVCGYGLSLIKEAGLQKFGERWAQDAGFASLIFDYRGFGQSDGSRNLIIIRRQTEDYRAVIRYARKHPDNFVASKIVAMGSALSGLSVATLCCDEPGLAGGMAHCPVLDGYTTMMKSTFDIRKPFRAMLDFIASMVGLPPVHIQVVGKPGELALLDSPSAWSGFVELYKLGGLDFADAPNRIPARFIWSLMSSRAGLHLKNAKCKMLVVMASDDDIIPPEVTREVVASAPKTVEFVVAEGDHFDIMPGGKGWDTNIQAQTEFLKKLLNAE